MVLIGLGVTVRLWLLAAAMMVLGLGQREGAALPGDEWNGGRFSSG